MSFNKGEYVSYGNKGICVILGIVEREICGKTGEYFELQPVYEEGVKLFVPVENKELYGKMKKLVSGKEIDEIIREIASEPEEWVESDSMRREKFRKIISGGNRRELMRLIRSVYNHKESLRGTTRKLHVADERFMKEAEKLLHEEFAFVLGIDPSQVIPYITKQVEG